MRIACISYREWALNIYDNLVKNSDHTFLIIRSKAQYSEPALRDFKPDIILFYGWSWIIEKSLLTDFKCLMLHPSPLPKYRGGSPIQNQIISGETNSMVTIFKMNEFLDAGEIYYQKEYSLEGSIDEIFNRISIIGTELTFRILNENTTPIAQNNEEATIYKRRKPSESEITIDELQNKSGIFLYNKIRMLGDPYPNAYIKTKDGKKLYITNAKLGD
jgi:methionyl-tRNA formyltransferase